MRHNLLMATAFAGALVLAAAAPALAEWGGGYGGTPTTGKSDSGKSCSPSDWGGYGGGKQQGGDKDK